MRLMALALLLSAGSVVSGQANPPLMQNPNQPSCSPSLNLTSPDVCVQSVAPALSNQPVFRPNQNLTQRGSSQVKQAIPLQLLVRHPNPIQLLALNQTAPQVAPNSAPHAGALPIPTTFPDAHFENIPTTWPGLKFLLVDQPPSATVLTEPKKK
jgi:hypothetical protein